MIAFDNGFIVVAAFVASLALWLSASWLRFRFIRQPWTLALPLVHLGAAFLAVVALWPPNEGVCREIPVAYLALWAVLLGGTNVVLGVSLFHQPLAVRMAARVAHWIRRGGFWGNHWSDAENERWPSTRDNAWGTSALALWLLVALSWWLYGSVPTPPVPPSSEPSLVAQVGTAGEEVFQGTNTPVEKVLQWFNRREKTAAALEASMAAHALPLYPKDTSWRWLFWLGLIWMLFANAWCRRDGVFDALGDAILWVGSLFHKRPERVAVSAVSGPALPPPVASAPAVAPATPTAPHAITESVPQATAPSRGVKGMVEHFIGPLQGLGREMVREVVAEGLVETIPQKIAKWLKKK